MTSRKIILLFNKCYQKYYLILFLKVLSSPTKEKLPQLPKKADEQKTVQEDKKLSKPILMTRRELTDPFGSDDEEEPLQKETPRDTKVVEINGTILNGNDLSPKENKDTVFTDLPKPNIVSRIIHGLICLSK